MYKVSINEIVIPFEEYADAFLFFSDAVRQARSEGFATHEISHLGENISFVGLNDDFDPFVIKLTVLTPEDE